jgi:hypothetical protein
MKQAASRMRSFILFVRGSLVREAPDDVARQGRMGCVEIQQKTC